MSCCGNMHHLALALSSGEVGSVREDSAAGQRSYGLRHFLRWIGRRRSPVDAPSSALCPGRSSAGGAATGKDEDHAVQS